MRILLDTNILIPLESPEKELSSDLAALKRQGSRLGVTYYVHPAQKSDIRRDADQTRRKIMLSRVEQYPEIISPPRLTTDIAQRLGLSQSKPNDLVDNQLLYSLHCGAVHALITEDAGIHRRARRIGLSDQVYNIVQAVQLLRKMLGDEIVHVPYGLKEVPLHNIAVYQEFFHSLREGYPKYDEWFRRVAMEQRKCW